MKAGIFDSGVGGLSVLDSILENNLFEEIIYYGDTARVPYGTKNPKTIIKYALEALEFFEQFDIDVLIFACNSVSAYAIDILQEKTNLKILGVIKAGVLATNQVANKNSKILIIGTKATINSNKYQNNLLELGYGDITSIPTPLFVPLIEEGILEGEILNLAMKHYFKNITKPDIVILGCTHYPFISKEINTFFNGTKIIHSGEAISQYLHSSLNITKKCNIKKMIFYASDDILQLEQIAKKYLSIKNDMSFYEFRQI